MPLNRLLIFLMRVGVLLLIVVGCLWLLVTRPTVVSKSQDFGAAISHVSPAELEQHVRLLSQEYFPRSHRDTENLDRIADFVTDYFRSHGGDVWQQEFNAGGSVYKNVISEYGPEDAPLVVIGAHYDSAGAVPAADDNASGVAGLLQLGRLLSTAQLNKRVVLVAFSLEEPPYFTSDKMGSAVFAQSLAQSSKNVELMISLEMIGYFSDEPGSQRYPVRFLNLFYPSRGNYIGVIDQVLSVQAQRLKSSMSEVMELPVYSINAPRFIPGIDFSDHRSFWGHGYPAVMVTDTAFYRNYAYHTLSDTADRLDYEKMAQVVYGVYHHVRKMSEETN